MMLRRKTPSERDDLKIILQLKIEPVSVVKLAEEFPLFSFEKISAYRYLPGIGDLVGQLSPEVGLGIVDSVEEQKIGQ